MATTVGLNMKMTASIAKFQSSMDKVERKLKAIEQSGKQTASGMKLLAGIEVGKLLVGGLTSVARLASSAASSVLAFSSGAAAAADKIGKLSTMTGMAEEPLQVFTQMASYGGVSSEQFGTALQKMSRGLGEAAVGSGTAFKALNRLGLSVDDLLGMSPSEQFMKIAAAIDQIEDPAARASIAADIFGRSGVALIPMFENIEETAAATAAEMTSLGQVLSADQVNNIEAMNDSFEKVRQTAFKIGTQVLANFAPALTAANNALMEMIKSFEYEGATGGQGVAKLLTDGLFAGARSMAAALDAFLSGFDSTTSVMQMALAKLITAFEIVSAPFIGSDAAARLGAFAQQLEGAAQQTSSVSVSFVDLVDQAQELWQQSSSATDAFIALGLAADNVDPAVVALVEGMLNATQSTDQLGVAIGQAAADSVSAAVNFGTELVSGAQEFVGGLVKRAKESDRLYDQFSFLVDAGLGTEQQLQRLADAASGTGSAALDALDRLYELARSSEMMSDTQDRLMDKMMSPIERWANQRQDFLEMMGFNPFYVEEQKRIWLAQQREAVQAQIDHAREAYLAFKESIGEAIELEMPEPVDPRPELEQQTGVLDGILGAVEQFGENFLSVSFS